MDFEPDEIYKSKEISVSRTVGHMSKVINIGILHISFWLTLHRLLKQTRGEGETEKEKSLNIDKLDCINKCGSAICARNIFHVFFLHSPFLFVAVFIRRHLSVVKNVCFFTLQIFVGERKKNCFVNGFDSLGPIM